MSSKVVLFSRDRAMQCDAALRSYFAHIWDDYSPIIEVIYYASEKHTESYEQLKKTYEGTAKKVVFVKQDDFRSDVFNAIDGYDYALFLVDDNIFVRSFSIEKAVKVLNSNQHVLTFSYRLGNNLIYCYPIQKNMLPPYNTVTHDGYYTYNWMRESGDWGYPMDISSSLHRVEPIKGMIYRYGFRNPNELEYTLDIHKNKLTEYPRLAYLSRSAAFCNPINKVNPSNRNRSGELEDFSTDSLLEKFMDGYRIDITPYFGFLPKSVHQEVEIVFKR